MDFIPTKRAFITVPSNGEVMSFISWLYDQTYVLDQQNVNSEISFEIEASSQMIAKAKKYVDDLSGSFVTQNAIQIDLIHFTFDSKFVMTEDKENSTFLRKTNYVKLYFHATNIFNDFLLMQKVQ